MKRLSTSQLWQLLKEQLEDDHVAEITDERLLVKGLLDPLLAESPDYTDRYRSKARESVLRIYQEVMAEQRIQVPKGFWNGKQGLLNVGMVLRPMIAQQGWSMDRGFFKKFSGTWVKQQKLSRPLYGHLLYGLIIVAYPEYGFDPKRPRDFHLHPWDVEQCSWNESLIREAVRHTVHFHMPWGLKLRELVGRFTLDFLKQENLGGVVYTRFSANPYSLFVFGFPEYVFDPAHPDRSHVHPWDAPHTTWSDDLIREAVRHSVKYHTDWAESELATKVTVRKGFHEAGLTGTVLEKFKNSPLRLLQFVYPELFEQGVLSEEDFQYLVLGRGAARFRHPLRLLPKKGTPKVSFENKRYHFPRHPGYFVHKISQGYGALYTPDKRLLGLFKWNTDPAAKWINIGKEDIEPIPPELTQPRRHLAFAEAVRVLADDVRIVVHDLPLGDQTTLTTALNIVEPSRVVDYLKLTGASGLRAMADTEFSAALVLVHELFDPHRFQQVLCQYNGINTMLVEISSLFTRHALTVPQAQREGFRVELTAKLFAANDRIINALSQALIYRDRATNPNDDRQKVL